MTNKIIVKNSKTHRIDMKIYGHFIEELGECIHDGLWVESDHLKHLPAMPEPLSGVRQDLMEVVAPLFNGKSEKTVLRWPGGCYSDTYHWEDGIGPRASRPKRPNTHWNKGLFRFMRNEYGSLGPEISNAFGTHEFIAFCKAIGAEPYINVNYGSGSPEEAAAWVEYCNGDETTAWGKKRAETSPKPYDVKYWGIGNEIWARWEKGFENHAENYAKRFLAYSKAMRAKDSSIKLIACGMDPLTATPLLFSKDGKKWNQILLEICGDHIDFISIHIYFPWYYHFLNFFTARFAFANESTFSHNEKFFRASMAASKYLQGIIDRVWDQIKKVMGSQTQVRIAMDEWNAWYFIRQMIKANYNLMDGLFVADTILTFQQNSDKIGLANYSQMVNCLGLIRTDDYGLVETPSYLAFKLLRNNCHSQLLDISISCDTVECEKLVSVPKTKSETINATATISDDDRNICIAIINKEFSSDIDLEICFDGFDNEYLLKNASQMQHNDPFIRNTPNNRKAITIREIDTDAISLKKIRLPKHSLTVINLVMTQ